MRRAALLICFVLGGCGGDGGGDGTPLPGDVEKALDGVNDALREATRQAGMMQAQVREVFEVQLQLMRNGDLERLKTHFTERVRDELTAEAVAEGLANLEKTTLDDLLGDISMDLKPGAETCRIETKEGRALTTLVKRDGRWLADTVWFR